VPECGKSHAVNAAFAVARGSIFALTDDDVVPDTGWLDRLAVAFHDTSADFVAGRVLPIWETPPPAWMSTALHGVLAIPDNGNSRIEIVLGGTTQVVPIGANMAVNRAVIERVGGLRVDLGKLDGTLRTGEDHEFFLRMLHAGFRGVYEPTAVVHHWVPTQRLARQYFRRWLYQNGRDVARLETSYSTTIRRLLGVPRYLWRQGARDVCGAALASLRGDEATRFAAEIRVLWLLGYAREAWFGQDLPPPTHRVALERAGGVSHAG
jgi:GT2 family glycosyltransferase